MKHIAMLWRVCLVICTIFIMQANAAQSIGKLIGRVTNDSGNGVPNAVVRLRSGAADVQRATTDADGRFTFSNLAEGSYQVDVETGGTSQTARQPLDIPATGSTSIELVFQQSETVSTSSGVGELELRASSPILQTDSAEVSRAYDTRMVRTLPLLDRQYQDLISLMPGITPPRVVRDRVLDPQRTRIYNVNGTPDYANAYYQDGAYQTEAYSARPSRIAPNESVQQMAVRTSNFNAEEGFAGGAAINLTTRPGTNGIHGSVFAMNTNRFFQTRNPLNTSTSDPGFNLNQFGGSIGGPIIKDKTFFFLSYEGYMRRGSVLQINSIPTPDFLNGNFNGLTGVTIYDPTSGNSSGVGRVPFPGNRIPPSSLSPFARTIYGYLPASNQPGFANNLIGGAGLREDQHRMDGKIDHRFSERSTGFLRYGFTQGDVNRGSQLGALGDAADAALRNHNAVISYTHSVTTNLAGELRLGYSRYRNAISPVNLSPNLAADLARFGFGGGLPQITIAGFDTLGLSGNYPSRPVNNTYDASTNWTWHNGMHNLKFGAQAVQVRADGFDPGFFSPRGSFYFGPGATSNAAGIAGFGAQSFNGLAGFLTGAPTVAGVSSFIQTPSYRQLRTAAYLTDSINLWKIVHLELGVRYDVYSPVETRSAGGGTVYDPVTNQIAYTGIGRIDSARNQKYDLNNVAPRIGIIVRPMSRLAFRAGYGIHYFPTPFALAGVNQTSIAAQNGVIGSFASTSFTIPAVTLPNLAGGLMPAPNQPYFSQSRNLQTPYMQTYNFTIQGDLGNGFLLDLGYVGNLGRQLPFYRDLNVSLPGTGLAGLPFSPFNRTAGVTYASTGMNSNYNAAQVNMTKRFGAGLSMAGAYAFGKVLDTGFIQSNPFYTKNNYGPADYDRKHILSVSHNWQLPFGPGSTFAKSGWAAQVLGSWELNGILRWATGTPYSVTSDPTGCNCVGLSSARANVIGPVQINGQASFDPTLFSNVTAATYGVQGRNVFRGPDMFTYDASLFRSFPVRDNYKIELRAEAYNVTNTTNYANPIANFSSPAFGRTLQTLGGLGGRQFQVGARILF
ncbi:TonB-dependent receptor [Bryobacter aggregatus]|uniref:TonB-dependent receptor n=1 Tax=Bryobacter aggregatus TaxID=360054 RepID=UPI00056C0508|nr:TonB-dependent receptor [Bryobacter aggregatus]